MKRFIWMLLLPLAAHCNAQNLCNTSSLSQAAARVLTLQKELEKTEVSEMDEHIPPTLADKITQLKDGLSRTTDDVMACAKPSIEPNKLQKDLVKLLHANPPEPPANTVISKDDHRFDEFMGPMAKICGFR